MRPRRPAAVRAVWTAPTARIDGIGRSSAPNERSLRIRTSTPACAASTASAASRVRAASRPAEPAVAGQVVARRRVLIRAARSEPRSPSGSTTIGRARRTVRGPRGGPPSSARPATQLHPQVHDRALALRVDRRVRDLGEGLAKVIGDRSVQPSAAGGRGVVAHAPQRLVRFERHRLDVQARPFGIQPGQVARPGGEWRSGFDGGRGGIRTVVVDRSRRVVDRHRPQDPGLRVGVLEDRVAARLDEEELARSQASAADRLGGGERDRPGLGGQPDDLVGRDGEGRRSQPVPVDQGSDPVPVREDHGGRTVPWREEAGGPAAPRGDLRMRRAAQGRGFRDRGDQGGRQRPAGRRQEFERLVEGQRVGAVRRQERTGGQQFRRHAVRRDDVRGPATDLLAVAADRVDLAVVGDRAERLGEAPDRVRVGGIALVEDRVIDGERRPQVRIEVGQSAARHEALVDDGPTRGGRDRELRDLPAGGPGSGLGTAPGDDEPALEGVIGDGPGVRV